MRGDGENGFWIDHPMLGALVSGGLLLALAGFVLDKFADRRAAQRWSGVAVAGFTGLAIETRDVLAQLWGVHSGPERDGDPRPIYEGLSPARELKKDLPGKGRVKIFSDPDLPGWSIPAAESLPEPRVRKLLTNGEWLDFARAQVEDVYLYTLSVTKDWAGFMIWAEEPRRLLNYFADFSAAITQLHGALNILGNNLGFSEESDTNNRERVFVLWQLADVKGRILVNELWKAAGWRQRMALPTCLQEVQIEDAFSRPLAVGSWRPVVPAISDPQLGDQR